MDESAVINSLALLSGCLITSCTFGEGENNKFDNINSREVKITTKDNLDISAQYYIPKSEKKYPTVILLHMLGKNKSSWNSFIPYLLNKDYAVFNIDMRGHGRSTKMTNGQEVFYQNMNRNDWSKLPSDVNDVINFISLNKFVDRSKIGIIGASIGANAAIINASEHPDKVRTLIALSPGLDYHGLKILEPAKNLKTPILFAVSEGDDYSYESSNQLNTVVKVKHDLLIYKGNAHGTNLLNESEDLKNKVINWLDRNDKE